MIAFLRKWPVHVLLLPLYFIASVYSQYAGLFDSAESVSVTLLVYLGIGLAFAVFYLIYRNIVKAGIATTIIGILYLFFGNIKELLRHSDLFYFISHYKTLVPLLFLLVITLFLWLRKRNKTNYQLNLFLNILLLIYLVIELWNFTRMISKSRSTEDQSITLKAPGNPFANRPNIYYILLDCYPGSGYQREVLNVEENDFDVYLKQKGFYVVDESRSNYNMTSFSIASLFNMVYLDWLPLNEKVKPYHYNKTIQLVRNALVFDWLAEQGYELHNLSVFDMPGKPSHNKEQFLSTTGKEIILHNTFWKCLYRDVFPGIFPSIKKKMVEDARNTRKERLQVFRRYNRQILDSLYQLPGRPSNNPKFVYAHLEMPHFPYFYDSTGKAYPDELVFGKDIITNKERFKNYIGYTNLQVMTLLDSVFMRNNSRDIIIIQSDHGLNDLDVKRRDDAFRNYTAFYFPDRDYGQMKNGLSNVNTFRIIFNKYFGQQLPLLKDSSSYIK
jgi:hypothetical protein